MPPLPLGLGAMTVDGPPIHLSRSGWLLDSASVLLSPAISLQFSSAAVHFLLMPAIDTISLP